MDEVVGVTDTEKSTLEARIDELCAENEKLRRQGERLFDKTLELGTENAKLRNSITRATEIITDMCGECPVSRYEWLSSNGCDERCEVGMEQRCWEDYLTGEGWG